MIQPQLFIDTGKNGSSNWLKADMNASNSITIKDAIKKSKDVGKVFTAYTNPFRLPASKSNNIIFKRFSNNKVYEGFDPRRKYDARIQLNGVDFKKGYIRLNKVSLVDGLPSEYDVQFFGELASLKDTLSETKLRDLNGLSKYSFPFNYTNVRKGFESGFDVVIADGAGLREETSIAITQVPSVTGESIVSLNGTNHSFQVSGGAGATTTSVASNIAYEINQIDGYTSASSYGIVLVVSDVNQVETPLSFSAGTATGLQFTVNIVQTGTDVPQSSNDVSLVDNTNGMFKFPMLSHTRGFEYTKTIGTPTNHEGFHRLLSDSEKTDNYTLTPSDMLDILDLKPAIRLPYIFEAIEKTFSNITFNKDWLFGEGNIRSASPINEMYLWLHNRKGFLGDDSSFVWQREIKTAGAGEDDGEWSLDTGQTEGFRPITVTSSQASTNDFLIGASVRVKEIAGTGNFQIKTEIFKVGSTEPVSVGLSQLYEIEDIDLSLVISFRKGITVRAAGDYYFRTTVTCDSSIGSFKPKCVVDVESRIEGDEFQAYKNFTSGGTGNRIIALSNINPKALMPDYKAIDFLSDLFKLYNLVAFEEVQYDGSYKINIQSYDYYINSGVRLDITKYIDIAKSSVERISPYSIVNYSFEKPKTFLAINQKEITGDDFGNATFNMDSFTEGVLASDSLLFDGGKYEVKPKLEKMMYERLKDSEKILTPIQWGWFVNDNKENLPEPAIGKPLFMFIVGRETTGYNIRWADNYEEDEPCMTPSNVSANGMQTLHFNAEFDEYTLNVNEHSLFKNFHSNYIGSIYSPFAKKINVEAYLPPLFFYNLKLNTTIIIDNISYFIDTMDINITTSKVKFSLLRTTDIETRLEGKDANQIDWENETVLWNTETKTWNQGGL
jgi:hypothetical protein